MRARNHADRRVRKTQNALYLALAEIMREKNLSSITVSELAEKADIHRATFYSHYTDIDELFEQIQKNTFYEIEQIFAPDPVLGKNMNSDEIFGKLIAFVYENKEVLRMFLVEANARVFYQKLGEIVEEMYLDIFWQEVKNLKTEENIKFLAKYHIQGCLAVISAWAEDDYRESPEKIGSTLAKIDAHYDRFMFSLFV
ncbi:TetR/AcrR family transcriptional regulator C-terminal domain-containing protein [Rothia amarae]|uniref:TetR/AcrR family transcriptional regulator C-terminal domain-containing protein n=2 Tax=Rothia amarae TaxID=169480 RepID=A0A802W2F0_9MICC|nr:TetR/AcrR family transcriptional regulator [Rothia amarae]QNV40921.2 TetR/AcrR family transcriptional regulator C-terminal domain-containing protein [Rothia amarae]